MMKKHEKWRHVENRKFRFFVIFPDIFDPENFSPKKYFFAELQIVITFDVGKEFPRTKKIDRSVCYFQQDGASRLVNILPKDRPEF